MKGVALRCLWAFILAVGVQSVRPDVLLLWQTYIFRYDEHDGALLSKTPRSLRPETIDSLAIGPDGDIYGLGNSLGWGSVVRFDGVTGAYKGFVISGNSGIHAPASIRFGPDGNLYLAAEGWSYSSNYMRLFRYDPKTGALKGEVIPQSAQVSSSGRMQSRACVDAAWENVMETPAVEGAAVTVDLPAHASNRLFRLVKP